MSPPKPGLALVVGVTGHRPNRLPQEALPTIEQSVARALDALKLAVQRIGPRYADCFEHVDAQMTLVSALAEGTDSIAARNAIRADYALDVVLPFDRDEYEKDFSETSRKEFRSFLGCARSILELSGDRTNEGKSYEAAGLAVLDASDILVAVWDGGNSAGRGGTTEIVAEAGRRGMPIIHIDAKGHALMRIIWQGLELDRKISDHIMDHPTAPFDAKADFVVDALMRPPANAEERGGLTRFLSEQLWAWNLRGSFPLLMAAFWVRKPRWSDVRPYSPETLASWAGSSLSGKSAVLATAYGWADAVGNYFSQMFRSAFIDNFLFSGLAVLAASLSLLIDPKWPFAVIELGLILWILFNTRSGLTHRWHQRWVEPREVAERMRVAIPMTMLGTQPFGPYGEAPTWTSWYARALLRNVGIVPGQLNAATLQAGRNALKTLLTEQTKYQDLTRKRFETLNHWMRRVGDFLLFVTIVAVVIHLILELPGVEEQISVQDALNRLAAHAGAAGEPGKKFIGDALIALSTALPALGAALFGIRTIGDFEGTAKRAGRMHTQLDNLSILLGNLPNEYHALRAFSHRTAEVMLGDVASWRLSAESRGLSVPG